MTETETERDLQEGKEPKKAETEEEILETAGKKRPQEPETEEDDVNSNCEKIKRTAETEIQARWRRN